MSVCIYLAFKTTKQMLIFIHTHCISGLCTVHANSKPNTVKHAFKTLTVCCDNKANCCGKRDMHPLIVYHLGIVRNPVKLLIYAYWQFKCLQAVAPFHAYEQHGKLSKYDSDNNNGVMWGIVKHVRKMWYMLK